MNTDQNKTYTLDFYLVRNQEGKWFRRKGYGGSGDTWVDNIKQARVYTKIGPARGIVGFFVNNYDEKYGIPDIIHFTADKYEVLPEADRVKKAKAKKIKADAEQEARNAKWRLESAQKELAAAQKRLAEATAKANVEQMGT